MDYINNKTPVFYTILSYLILCLLVTSHSVYAQSTDDVMTAPFPQKHETGGNTQEEAQQEPSSSATSNSPLLDLIISNREKKTSLKSKSWNNTIKNEETEKPQEEEVENNKESDQDQELTESQKIWKHYYDLAQKDKTQKTETERPEEEEEKAQEKTEDKQQQESSSGIYDILKRYKDSQKNQGQMNSRSFGSID
ncbi:MAG: hypothetical protein KAJ40_03740 [Alphaproteobacteria bacterium]|nr:hypothetical protein [Alphaproteobacteria bacterium]